MQNNDEDYEQVIYYASCGTNDSERNYSTTQLEYLMVIWAIQWFQHYLLGWWFKVIMDHMALKWLYKQKEPSGLFIRWIMKMQSFDIEICYCKGKMNQNADALSRIPCEWQNTTVTIIIQGRWNDEDQWIPIFISILSGTLCKEKSGTMQTNGGDNYYYLYDKHLN